MSKLFTNKNFIQKTMIVIILLLLITFVTPTYSRADVGGVLAGPIFDLLAGIGDVILAGCNAFFIDGSFVPSNGSLLDLTLVKWDQEPFKTGASNSTHPEYDEIKENGTPKLKIEADKVNGLIGDGDIRVPFTRYSPEKIFSGEVPAFDVNFINPKDWGNSAQNNKSIAHVLQGTISKWYVALRNLATVGMLIVLLYVGIRMIISSTASDKAKYKEFLKDWLIALCLLFTLHYIMTFTVTIVTSITESIVGNSGNTNNITVEVQDGGTKKFSFNTDIMGYARFLVQHDDFGTKVLNFIIFIAMVIYTVMFTITYLKRSIIMAFLTLIAPLIAITYPIDKMHDGSAQGFNSWLKEYVYNALIQPFHLIIYTVLAGSAVVDLSTNNPVYAIVVLAFLTQAEKLLRKFFGFEKSSTAGALGSFAGGAAAMGLVQKLTSKAATRGGKSGGGSSKIRTKDKPVVEDNNAPSSVGDFADSRLAGGSDGTTGTSGGVPILGGGSGSGPSLAPGETMTSGGVILPAGVSDSRSSSGSGSSRSGSSAALPPTSAGKRTQWTQDDARGAGSYIKDSWNNSAAKRNLMAGSVGKSIRFVGGKANSVRTKAGELKQRAGNQINKIPKPIRNSIRGASAVMANVGKKGLKVAGRAAVGGLGASIGLAAGIAGADLEDVMKFGAAGAGLGATAGYSALGGLGTSVMEGAGSVRDTYNEKAKGYNAAQIESQTKQFMKDKEMMKFLNEAVPTEDGQPRTAAQKKEMMKNASEFYNSGVTDQNKLAKAMKLESTIKDDIQGTPGMSDQEKADAAKKRAMLAAKFAEKVDDKKLVDETYVTKVQQSWARGMVDETKGINQAAANKEAAKMMQYVKKLKKVN